MGDARYAHADPDEEYRDILAGSAIYFFRARPGRIPVSDTPGKSKLAVVRLDLVNNDGEFRVMGFPEKAL